ncbi:MAG: toll/interleukin-1 receptor domain-containing protein [Acidobacteria bacterium]|nr:toll/interleukin-1 receptor domain-containing protein [Acidobacteriota bacterium]
MGVRNGIYSSEVPAPGLSQRKIFCSYSHEDRKYLDELVKHLRQHSDVWYDHQIKRGEEWRPEIYRNIESADVFVALVSGDFLDSEWCMRELAHARSHGIHVIAVILRGCHWVAEFGDHQVVLVKDKPLRDPKRCFDASQQIKEYFEVKTRLGLPRPQRPSGPKFHAKSNAGLTEVSRLMSSSVTSGT